MKRIISIVLIIAMVLALSVSLVGCRKKIDTGTEAAKLLLANERLDQKLIGGKIDLGLNGTSVLNVNSGTPVALKQSSLNAIKLSSSGISHTWNAKDFKQHSHSMVEFTQFMGSIEESAERAATDIANIKNKVGVTDKWVKSGLFGNEYMLRVYESKEVLFTKIPLIGNLEICVRYTNESAKNVYEMYCFMDQEELGTARQKLVYIPGERYEYYYVHSSGFRDYFVAENSRGYWIATRFTVDEDWGASFSPIIIKDGLGYGASITLSNDGIRNDCYDVFDPANNRELFRFSTSSGISDVNLYFTGIKDGLVSVTSNDAEYDSSEKVYQAGRLDELVTENGKYNVTDFEQDEANGEFIFNGGYVQHYYDDGFDYGSLQFTIMYNEDESLSDYIDTFDEYASSIGLDLYCDMDNVAKSLYHAQFYASEFATSFVWNGYEMSSRENATKAQDVLFKELDDALNSYNEVKDFPQAEEKQKLSKDAHFAAIESIVAGENTYANGIVTLSNIGISISDTSLFELNADYVLKVGLSLCDENGNPITVNTVPLESTTELTPITYTGDVITLTGGGSYTLPKNLSQGDYVLVVYASTEDGIRVSEMKKIAFLEIEEGKLDSTAMDIEISRNNDNLQATYTIKNIIRLEMKAEKESYSYNEVRREIMKEILAKGYPDADSVLEYENGEAVESGAALGKGTYRMMAYLATSDGLAQSYVYLTIN